MKSKLTVFGVARDLYGNKWDEHRLFFYDEQALNNHVVTRQAPIRGMMRLSHKGCDLAMPYVRIVRSVSKFLKHDHPIEVRCLHHFVNAHEEPVHVHRVLGYEVHLVGKGSAERTFVHDKDGGCVGYFFSSDIHDVLEALVLATSNIAKVEAQDPMISTYLDLAAGVLESFNHTDHNQK